MLCRPGPLTEHQRLLVSLSFTTRYVCSLRYTAVRLLRVPFGTTRAVARIDRPTQRRNIARGPSRILRRCKSQLDDEDCVRVPSRASNSTQMLIAFAADDPHIAQQRNEANCLHVQPPGPSSRSRLPVGKVLARSHSMECWVRNIAAILDTNLKCSGFLELVRTSRLT
jgi:hypothetical protein